MMVSYASIVKRLDGSSYGVWRHCQLSGTRTSPTCSPSQIDSLDCAGHDQDTGFSATDGRLGYLTKNNDRNHPPQRSHDKTLGEAYLDWCLLTCAASCTLHSHTASASGPWLTFSSVRTPRTWKGCHERSRQSWWRMAGRISDTLAYTPLGRTFRLNVAEGAPMHGILWRSQLCIA